APFAGGDWLDVLIRVRTEPVRAPTHLQPGIPGGLEAVCLKCLEKDPAHRYASAGELATELRRFLAGERIVAAADVRPGPPRVAELGTGVVTVVPEKYGWVGAGPPQWSFTIGVLLGFVAVFGLLALVLAVVLLTLFM